MLSSTRAMPAKIVPMLSANTRERRCCSRLSSSNICGTAWGRFEPHLLGSRAIPELGDRAVDLVDLTLRRGEGERGLLDGLGVHGHATAGGQATIERLGELHLGAHADAIGAAERGRQQAELGQGALVDGRAPAQRAELVGLRDQRVELVVAQDDRIGPTSGRSSRERDAGGLDVVDQLAVELFGQPGGGDRRVVVHDDAHAHEVLGVERSGVAVIAALFSAVVALHHHKRRTPARRESDLVVSR